MRYELFGIIPESGQWRWSQERSLKAIEDYKVMLQDLSKSENEITQEEIDKWYLDKINETGEEIDLLRLSKNSKPEHYISPSETTLANDVWFDLPPNSTSALKALFGAKVFDNPKPIELIKRFLYFFTDVNSIILDFFAGSGTTGQAVLELNKEDGGNRKFILVQMPEQCDENSESFKAGYKTIADIAKERIRRVIQKIEKEKAEKPNLFEEGKLDLGFKVFKLASSNFKIWRSSEIDSAEKLVEQLDAFTDPIRPGAEKQNMLYELMLKAGYEITSSVQYVIASGAKQSQKGRKIASGSANPRNDNIGFYSINNNELIIALDSMNEKLIKQIIAVKPQKVITLDSLFTGNDQLKTNTVLQMRDAGVDFKTI
jgi:adenine-specific DNA-methyltransferase